MTLWLVRHARPLIAPGVCYGALDVPADATATRHAAANLAAVLPEGVTMISSTLQRCELLAQSIQALRPDLTYKIDVRLTEMNFGSFEGIPWDSIAISAYDAWTADFWCHRFGGKESLADLMSRVASAWDEAHAQGQSQVWVTHAGVIRASRLLAYGVRQVERADQWPVDAPGFGQWCALQAQA